MSAKVVQLLKDAALAAAKSPAFDQFVGVLESATGRQPGLLRVLTYHRIDDPARRPWLDPGLISASVQDFEAQMAYLKTYYRVVAVSEVLAAVKSGKKEGLPPRAVLVTFDDAYLDFEEHAWPVLRRYQIPATMFVPTAFPDQPEQVFWWDDLYHSVQSTALQGRWDTPIGALYLSDAGSRNHAYQRLKTYMKTLNHAEAMAQVREMSRELGVQRAGNCTMSWDSLRQLNHDGLTLGSHTRTHPSLNRISLEEAREEVNGSFEDLKREVGAVLPIFAYPGGQFNADVVSMLDREGISLAFTTRRGLNNIRRLAPLRINRINVGGRTSLPLLRVELLSGTAGFYGGQSRLHA